MTRRERDPVAEARGLYVVRLHQALEDWRDRRRLARSAGWPRLAAALIEAEIGRLEREIDECVRQWI
jgi:hypothetical protein